jgi:hypothetical protein
MLASPGAAITKTRQADPDRSRSAFVAKVRTPKCKTTIPQTRSSPKSSQSLLPLRVDLPLVQSAPSALASQGLTSRALARVHPDLLSDMAYLQLCPQMGLAMDSEMRDAAALASLSFHKQMHPKDALERLVLGQILLAHSRTAWLTQLLVRQNDPQCLHTISEACERAAGTFGRLTRAFWEYRRPSAASAIVSIGQANVAHQQVVQNLLKEEPKKKDDVRTGIASGTTALPAALPAHAGRPKVTAECHPENEALEKKHRPSNFGRKGEKRDEPAKAR